MGFIEDIYKIIGENDNNQDVKDWLSTGVLPLNKAISGKYDGGFPVGRMTEVYGAESSGKTLLATMAMIETQKKGGLAVFLDFEHAFSMSRAKQLGLIDDKDKWLYKQPETAEEGFKIIDAVVNAVRKYDIDKHVTVVIDSVASMMTKEELEAGYDESNMKTKLSLAALLSASLKKIANLINKANITLLLLNQIRDNPGIMFGDKEKTAGGRAIKFYCSTRIKLSKSGKIKDANDKIIGETIVAQITKNKVYEPFNVCEYISDFVDGINLELTHLKDLKEKGYFGDVKGWYEFDGKKYREKDLLDLMKNDKNFYNEILKLYFHHTPMVEATND